MKVFKNAFKAVNFIFHLIVQLLSSFSVSFPFEILSIFPLGF